MPGSTIDLNTGEYRWRVPLGEFPELAARGVPSTGAENNGGPWSRRGACCFDRDWKSRAVGLLIDTDVVHHEHVREHSVSDLFEPGRNFHAQDEVFLDV